MGDEYYGIELSGQRNVQSDLLNGKPLGNSTLKGMRFCVVLCDSHFQHIFMRNFLRFGFVLGFIFLDLMGLGRVFHLLNAVLER